jgi:hypothetical protein
VAEKQSEYRVKVFFIAVTEPEGEKSRERGGRSYLVSVEGGPVLSIITYQLLHVFICI